MTERTQAEWKCPKDGTPMQPQGRRSRAGRCQTCKGIFIDTEARRRGRGGSPPWWAPVVTSVLLSLLGTAVARWLRRRRLRASPQREGNDDEIPD